jgi:type I restriction enzyme S subunit
MSFKISEVCDINSLNLSKNDNLKTINYLDTANLNVGTVDELQYMEVGKDKIPSRAKRIVRKNDILISTVRPNQKHYGIIKNVAKNMVASTGFAVLTPKEDKVDPGYIYNYLIQDHITTYLHSIAESSTSAYPSIKPSVIGELEVDLPPLQEQKAIAHVLSTLDDKIEVNNQINKTIENMAQAIFKHWFVDFEFPNEDGEPYKSSGGEMIESELGMIPKGWEVGTLNDVIDFQNGYAFKSKDLLDENIGNCYHVFKMGHINKGGGLNKEGTKSYVLKKDYEDLSRYILKKGDLLMCMTDMKSNVALLGHTALMDEDNKYILNQRVGLLRIKDEKKLDYPFIYVLTNSNDFLESLRSRANSGVQVNLSTKEIKESQLIIPGEKTHELFNNIAKALFEEYFNLGKENDQLISLRDALLPKLMSGEIRVPLDEEGEAS